VGQAVSQQALQKRRAQRDGFRLGEALLSMLPVLLLIGALVVGGWFVVHWFQQAVAQLPF
jgi:hypothetical protein